MNFAVSKKMIAWSQRRKINKKIELRWTAKEFERISVLTVHDLCSVFQGEIR